MKFICEVPGSMMDEIFIYNEILDHIEIYNSDLMSGTEQLFKFQRSTAHQGHLHPSNKDWKGSKYNVLVDWKTGETRYEPLQEIATDGRAEYTRLLDTDVWQQFKRLAKSEKNLKRMISQAKLKAYHQDHFGSLVFLYLEPMLKR
jgi:hypothetical protein